MRSFSRRLIKIFHPEGIPAVGAFIYNKLSGTDIFLRHYDEIAEHIMKYATSGELVDIGVGPARLLPKIYDRCPDFRITGVGVMCCLILQKQS